MSIFSVKVGGKEYKADDIAPAGTKYNRYGTGRTGLATALDVGVMSREIQREVENLGEGSYTFQLTSSDGKTILNDRPLKFGDRMFYPSPNGTFHVVDDDYVRVQHEKYKEVEEYVDNIMEKVLISNSMAELILGKATYDSIPADSLPSTIRNLHPQGTAFAKAMSDLREIVAKRLPIMEGMTTKSVLHEK